MPLRNGLFRSLALGFVFWSAILRPPPVFENFLHRYGTKLFNRRLVPGNAKNLDRGAVLMLYSSEADLTDQSARGPSALGQIARDLPFLRR